MNYIISNIEPTIFKIGSLPIRWYGLLFVAGFLLAPRIVEYIYKTEHKPIKDVELTILHVMIGTIVGARLGHVIFYDLQYYLKHPIEAFLPISLTPHFHITGYQGLASHGALLGILTAQYIYSKFQIHSSLFPPKLSIKRQNRPGQSYLWMLNITAIGVALGGATIRMGNFMNSEVYGTPTNKNYGILFAKEVTDIIKENPAITKCKIIKDKSRSPLSIEKGNTKSVYQPISIVLDFKKLTLSEQQIKFFLENNIKQSLISRYYVEKHVYESPDAPLDYKLEKDNGTYRAIIHTYGIPRHPAQLYEGISCIILFILLLLIWKLKWRTLREGYLAGIFCIYIFGLRFFYEFLKESKRMPGFESLSRPHILSIMGVIFGILFIVFSNPSKHTSKKK